MRRLLAVTTLLIAVAAGTAGCGGDGPKPQTWARSVCSALGPWRTEINKLNAQAQQQITKGTTAAQTKGHLLELLGGAERASEDARAKVTAAGTPDVRGGAEIARRFQASLTKARDAYRTARQSVDALSTADPTRFYDGVVAAFTRLKSDYAASGLDTSNVGSTELQRAFREVPECR